MRTWYPVLNIRNSDEETNKGAQQKTSQINYTLLSAITYKDAHGNNWPDEAETKKRKDIKKSNHHHDANKRFIA